MEYLLDNLSNINNWIKGKKVCLFLDYDGTLTPITTKPSQAILAEDTRLKLESLAENEHCQIAIISGREINELKRLINIPKIWYSGNHGLELETSHISYKKSLPFTYLNTLNAVRSLLKVELVEFKEVWIEDKGMTISIHYRELNPFSVPKLLETIQKIFSVYEDEGVVEIYQGKMVLEIRPNTNWNKGSAVLRFLKEIKFNPEEYTAFYIGDDTTDEDAFEVLNNIGITIHVGNNNLTKAKFNLNSVKDVITFIEKLAIVLNTENKEITNIKKSYI